MSDAPFAGTRFHACDFDRAGARAAFAVQTRTGPFVEDCKKFIGEAPSRFRNEQARVALPFGS